MTNNHKGVLIEARAALNRIIEGYPNREIDVYSLKQALTRLDAFLADVPDLKDGLEHLEEFNEIHRHYEEGFEDAAILLHQATKGRNND